MSDEAKDNLQSAAPEGTTAQTQTQSESEGQPAPSAPQGTTEARKYAGSFNSVEDLEKAYSEARTKISQKGYAEKLGEQVVQATGYSVSDLEKTGYSPQDIIQAVTNFQDTGRQQDMVKAAPDQIKDRVESSKVENLEFELELMRFAQKNPDVAEVEDWVRKMKKHPDYREKSVSDIFEDLKPMLAKGGEAVMQKHAEKERASMNFTNATAPDPKPSEKAREKFFKTGRDDDAKNFVKERLKEKGWL